MEANEFEEEQENSDKKKMLEENFGVGFENKKTNHSSAIENKPLSINISNQYEVVEIVSGNITIHNNCKKSAVSKYDIIKTLKQKTGGLPTASLENLQMQLDDQVKQLDQYSTDKTETLINTMNSFDKDLNEITHTLKVKAKAKQKNQLQYKNTQSNFVKYIKSKTVFRNRRSVAASNSFLSCNDTIKIYHSNITTKFYVLCDETLHIYQYNNNNNTWNMLSVVKLPAQDLYFADILNNGQDMLISKTEEGFNFYENDGLKLITRSYDFEENQFHNVYGWNKYENVIKLGHFYYDTSLVGILTKHEEYGINFYVVIKDELLAGQYPIWELDTDFSILGNYSHMNLFLADLNQNGQDNIITHSRQGLNIFKFNQDNIIKHLMHVNNSNKLDDSDENIYFPNLTGQIYRDIVLLNSSGLFVYQYINEIKNYNFINYNPLFSKLKGWDLEYINSIQFCDVDIDGKQDMIFTGPEGINMLTFNNYTYQWEPMSYNLQLSIPKLYSDVLKVLPTTPKITKHPIILTKYKNQLDWNNIVKTDEVLKEEQTEPVNKTVDVIISKTPIIPTQLQPEEEKYILLLRDRLDCSFITNAVDKNTGNLKFKLPLIDLSNLSSDLKLDFIYDSNSQAGIMGVGWSVPLNFIMMNHQSSIFAEDEKYYISLQDMHQELIFDTEVSTKDIYVFKFQNNESNLQIRYYKNEERWELNNSGVKQIYGRTTNLQSEAINWELVWNNWRSVGSSSTGQKQLATAWYLVEIRDDKNNVLKYTYDSVNVRVLDGKSFTQEIYLKTISDGQGNNVIFKYSNKDPTEYKIFPLIDEDHNINTHPVGTRYLLGYVLTTSNYHQSINFVYKLKDGNRFLTEIRQDGDVVDKAILHFAYKDMPESVKSYVLERVILPSGVNVEFIYEMLGTRSTTNEKIGQRYDVQKNYRIDYGSEDVLISYLDRNGQVVLRMFNQEMTKELYSSISSSALSRFPLIGRGLVNNYEVIRAENFFAIVLHYYTRKQIYLFYKQNSKWPSIPKYFEFNDDAVIKVSNDFVVVATTSSVETINWNKNSNEWKMERFFTKSGTNKLFLAASNRLFLIYDDFILRLGYKNRNNEWQSKVIKKIPGIIKDIIETLNKFDIDSQTYNQLLNYFQNNVLQLNNNLLILNRWKAEDSQIYSIINLFTLDSSYKIVQEQEYKFIQDDLNNFSREINNEENFFTIAYKVVNNKFKVTVKDFRGPILDSINETKNQKKRNEEKNIVYENVIKSLGKPFLLNPRKYYAEFNSQQVLCDNKSFTFNGNTWNMNTLSPKKHEKLTLQLGDKFVLDKEKLNFPFKLYQQGNNKEKLGNSLLNLEINHLNQTVIRYPVYLAYQENNAQISVVEFINDIAKVSKLPEEEKISHWSGYQILVTSIDSTDITTLIFRQQLGIGRLFPNPVIKKVIIHFHDNSKQITGYEYSSAKAVGNTVYYENSLLIKGDNKTSFGWIEEARDFNNQSNVEKRIFNGYGKLIKTLKLKEQKNDEHDEENVNLNSTLLDKTGKLEVAQFSPHKIPDEEVSYYGFEDYEINVNSKKWIFNQSNIIKDKHSFTGHNYLSLSQEQIMEGIFQPKNQNQEYVASCWARPHSNILKLGSAVPYLKTIVYNQDGNEIFGLLSEVKLKSGDWYYLEVIVDLLFAKQMNNDLFNTHTNSDSANVKLKASIYIGSGVNTTIDIDHVRFSPLSSNFQANVYDFKTNQVKEVILANGYIKKFVYDKYIEEIATVNEYGQIEEFNTYTKSSSIANINQYNSIIQIKPEDSFYENFSTYSFSGRWKIEDANAWTISPRQLHHLSNVFHKIKLNLSHINTNSYGIRFYFSLKSINSVIKFNNCLKIVRDINRTYIAFTEKQLPIPSNGEILLIQEHRRLFVWIDGGLYVDSLSNNQLFDMEMSGMVKISDFMFFNEPSIHVTYLNSLAKKIQEIVLEDTNAVTIKEYLYDELGRQSITTQPTRMYRSMNQTMLKHYSNFVTNKNPYSTNSVWKINKLQGDITKLIGEYSYTQTKYNNNPLDEKCAVGLPGKEFSATGIYAKQFSTSSENLFIKNHFPPDQNYNYKVEHKPGLVEDISVYDNKNNRVAWYIHVPGSKTLLSTYEYDNEDKLTKSLSPLYHERIGTFHKLYSEMQKLTQEEISLQESIGTHISYDKKGNIISTVTADSGKVEHLYDTNELLRFTLQYSIINNKDIENVIYFDYDILGRLISTGKLKCSLPKKELLTLTLTGNNTEEYQQFYHSDFEREPVLRGKIKRTITINDGEPFIEESVLNLDKESVSKRIIIPVKDNDMPLLIAVNKKYSTGKLKEIQYPFDIEGEPFRLTYQYNKLGKVIGIGIPGKQNLFAKFTYNAEKQVISEQHLPENKKSFIRHYSYNSPGFLTQLEDKFLTEKVFYTDESYGGRGYGDGTITRTEFKAKWHESCDNKKLGINKRSFISKSISAEESELCFDKLKESGYIDKKNHQGKIYYPALEPKLPIVCSYGITGRQIQRKLGEDGYPSVYGHSYDYGNHQELTKAKYILGYNANSPLQPDTFSKEISDVNITISSDIWNLLRSAMYIIDDDAKVDSSLAHAKRGKSFIRQTLFSDLRNLNTNYGGYKLPIERFLGTYFLQNLTTIKSNLRDAFIKWNGRSDVLKQTTNKIIDMLEEKQYLQNPLTDEFKNTLSKYQSLIPDIVRVLSERFAKQLGEAEFDVESYEIDANGNHKHYYTGFERYEINYHNNSNQAESVKLRSFASSKPERSFSIKHDSKGNIIQALHKGIQNIIYNSVTNRAIAIKLVDDRTLHFHYDAQGERVLKRVINNLGQTTKEIHYIRDEFGRTLVEREVTYVSPDLPPDLLVTAYIYGPRGLLGFIRRDEFYSVITDHEGSIRLVVKGEEVVAAYDYLPYGNLMRKFGNNPEAHISYRYTAQEWDEETGLYNYHARFYDPSIGRFYQIDPKCQYFSPYKYAGNSPVSMIDPDGQFAFLLIAAIILGTTGAFLGGAAANKNWNPAKWNWKSGSTWAGILGGGVGGALLPVGFGASVAALTGVGLSTSAAIGTTIGLGVGVAYISASTANDEWNFTKWDYSSPETWNGVFQGFAIGSGSIGGIRSAASFYKHLSSVGKGFFIVGSVSSGGGIFVINGFNANWDFSKPGVYLGFVDAITGAPDLPTFFKSAFKFGSKNVRNIGWAFSNRWKVSEKLITYRAFRTSKFSQGLLRGQTYLKGLFTHSNYQFPKSVINLLGGSGIAVSSALLMGNAVSDHGWDMNSANTYYAMINGILTGGQLTSTGKGFYKRQQTYKKIKLNKKTEKLFKIIADDAVNYYNNILKTDYFDHASYDSRIKASLDEGKIPNRVISIAITDRVIAVGFSTNSAPGLVMIYTHNKLSSPIIKHATILKDNQNIAGSPVTLSDHIQINEAIKNAIDYKQGEIKKNNAKRFLDQTAEGILNQRLNEASNLEYVRDNIINDIEQNIIRNGYSEESFIDKVLQKHLTSENPEVKEITDKLKTLEYNKKKLTDLKKKTSEDASKISSISNEIKEIKKIKKTIENRVNAETSKKLTDLRKEILKPMDELKNKVTHWSPINCAEPHAIAALSRRDQLFQKNPTGFKNYNVKDIKYLASYKLDRLPELTPYPRCDHCVETTAHVKNVLTDSDWLRVLNDKLLVLNEKLNANKKKLIFLAPIADVTSRIANRNITDDRNNTDSIRIKRSILDRPNITTDKNVSFASQPKNYNSNKTNNDISEKKSLWNNLFTWARNSIGELLYSTPALSIEAGRTSSSNISQIDTHVDINSSILLLDIFVKKITGQKYISNNKRKISNQEAYGYVLNITMKFEKIVIQAALKSCISMHRLNIDFIGMQKEITKKIISGKLNEIAAVLNLYVEKACYHRKTSCFGKLSQKKFDKFMTEINSKLDIVLNKSIQKILSGEQNTPNILKNPSLNSKRPTSYLNAISQSHISQNKSGKGIYFK